MTPRSEPHERAVLAPSCSVIIPCYNGAKFIPATVGSVLSQTRPPLEIIVVDDGSTDDSADVAERCGPSVRVIRQANQGESVARNVGLRTAVGDYVVFLDADDMLAPEAIARLTAAVQGAPGAVAVMGTALFTDDPTAPFDRQMPKGPGFFPDIIRTNFGPPSCWLTPRDVAVKAGGFREDLINSEDWEFWGRIAVTGAQLVVVPYYGALYRKHAQSQVATMPKPAVFKGRLTVCETMAAGILKQPQLLEDVGETLFWSLWAMLEQARAGGVPASDLERAESLLTDLARQGPAKLRHSAFAMAIRYFGVRAAGSVRRLISPSTEP